MIHSYPKIYNLGHPAITTLFDTPVTVQEKYDGSQLSWGWFDGQLIVKSKGTVQYGPERSDPDKMFAKAVAYLSAIDDGPDGYVFRGEWFSKPKHNTIAYDHVPDNGLILFDVESQPDTFFSATSVQYWADTFGISMARRFGWDNAVDGVDAMMALLELESTLGGSKIEGVVFKAYDQFGRDGKALMGKYVSEKFKEKHKRSWGGRNPNQTDVTQDLIASLNTEARWAKAIQHLRDDGLLTDTPKDIGPLMKEVKSDTAAEEIEFITEKLVAHFLPKVIRGVGRGLPEYYKALLAEQQFDA